MQRSALQMYGQLSIAPAQAPGYDYLVKVGNVGDIGYNPDEYKEREMVALSALKTQCAQARVVGETAIHHGTVPLQGKPAKTYFMRVKCG
ncbi:hypothetical protein J2857_003111 [Neorhizobium galegae]|uniref:hypothetical protein n=1 Tax=Neorhizobium galegae TaxID=399 RepID=UPI001AE3CADD|nr:hypothetical protein [Neorhizobium galegae]MBP2560342.1 hypothetical protein [Neorhizobium galegae]